MVVVSRDDTERKRGEEALRDSQQCFARFMRHLPGLAWIKDLTGRYVYVNDAAEKAFGTARADLYGKTDDEVSHRKPQPLSRKTIGEPWPARQASR